MNAACRLAEAAAATTTTTGSVRTVTTSAAIIKFNGGNPNEDFSGSESEPDDSDPRGQQHACNGTASDSDTTRAALLPGSGGRSPSDEPPRSSVIHPPQMEDQRSPAGAAPSWTVTHTGQQDTQNTNSQRLSTAAASGNGGSSNISPRKVTVSREVLSSPQVEESVQTSSHILSNAQHTTGNRQNGGKTTSLVDTEKEKEVNPFIDSSFEEIESEENDEEGDILSDDLLSSEIEDASENLEVSTALGLAEDHFARPEGTFDMSSIEELESAIQNCKEKILQSSETVDKRKNLVHKLIQLRIKLTEMREGPVEEEEGIKVVVGHRFKQRETKSSKHYCENCASVIWGVLQTWYKCTACGYCCHDKCLNLIYRTCANAKVSENPHYILSICPEKGLGGQNYRCAECSRPISYNTGGEEPRRCDYTGAYYCRRCHWNDTMIMPARVLHNWDLEPRKVCRASKQFMRLMETRACLRIQDINPMLFSFVEELNEVKKLREEILIMKRYFLSCQDALNSKLLLQLKERQHFVENSDTYSLQDLLDVAMDQLLPELAKIHTSFAQHIKTDCQLCQAKGYMCELCDMNEVLFPFDNIAIVCDSCSTVLHRHCFLRKNRICPKCERLNRRAALGGEKGGEEAVSN